MVKYKSGNDIAGLMNVQYVYTTGTCSH